MNNYPVSFYVYDTRANKPMPMPLDEHCRIQSSGAALRWQPALDTLRQTATKLGFEPIVEAQSQKQGLIVLFADDNSLCRKAVFDELTCWEHRPINTADYEYLPVLTIGVHDFRNLYAEHKAVERNEEHRKLMHRIGFDARIKFLDASIWHRYLPIEARWGPDRSASFEKRLNRLLAEFKNWLDQRLYSANAARATLEFQLRMLKNAHIVKMGQNGHYEAVRPFKFHSEAIMRLRTEELTKHLFSGHGEKLKWKFLLIDDFANQGISAGQGKIALNKKQLIEQLLQRTEHFPKTSLAELIKVPTSEKDIVVHTLTQLKGKEKFDVILLDYLLGHGYSSRREYGYELLLELVEDSQKEKPEYLSGPFMRHWVFPISSFPFAMYDKLRQLGIDHYHKLWHLSGGGDPITTPHLFTFNLLHFLSLQVKEVYLDDDMLAAYLSNYNHLENVHVWAQIVSKRVGNLSAKVLLLKEEQDDSAFKQSLLHIIQDQEYDKFIQAVASITRKLDEFYDDRSASPDELPDIDKAFKTYEQHFPKSIKLLKAKWGMPLEEADCRIAKAKAKAARRLDLRDLYLRSCPKHLNGELPELRKLNLNNNYIKSIDPEISGLAKLERLELRNNRLTRLPDVIRELNGLESLDLTDNKIYYLSKLSANNRNAVEQLIKEHDSACKQELQIKTFIGAADHESALAAFATLIRDLADIPSKYPTQMNELKQKLNETKSNHDLSQYDRDKEPTDIRTELMALLSDFMGKERKRPKN